MQECNPSSSGELKPATGEGSWLVLVNPRAGSGIPGGDLEKLSSRLDASDIPHRTVVTDSPEQLVDFASLASGKGYCGVIGHGGDGTLSHAASGLIHSRSPIPLTIVPRGTGNDWGRTVGITSMSDTVAAIRDNRTVRLDAAECLVRDDDGSNIHSSIFINSAGIGLDAHVLQMSIGLRKKYRLGRLGYISTLFSTVLEMPRWEGAVRVDGETVYRGPYLSLTSGVCRYVGGGMRLSPSSDPTDDMLDTAIVRPITRRNLIASVHMIYRGTLLSHPAVSSWRGRVMELDSMGPVMMELDGEPVTDLPRNCTVILRSIPAAFLALRGPSGDM